MKAVPKPEFKFCVYCNRDRFTRTFTTRNGREICKSCCSHAKDEDFQREQAFEHKCKADLESAKFSITLSSPTSPTSKCHVKNRREIEKRLELLAIEKEDEL